MKRIGIHTITDYVNYGNRLQNYATQEILKQLGYKVESIINYPTPPTDDSISQIRNRVNAAFNQSPIQLLKRISKKIKEKRYKSTYIKCQDAKAKTFKEFTKKHIKESDFVLTLSSVPEDINNRYDYCVVGSDQIWNPNIRYGSSLDFLSYVSPEKRIALAPSIGVSHIPENYKPIYRQYLNEMALLSVREEKGAEIIQSLCGKSAEVLVDPTIVLKTNEWKKIVSRAHNKPKSPYLVCYFIGEVSTNRYKKLQYIAKTNKLELVMLNSLHDTVRYSADPGEFIDYIRSSTLVCTDSFHCIIFSMHFQRPFVVFDREGKSAPMGSRIDTLLKKFEFGNRKLNEIEKNGRFFDIHFEHVPAIMDAERGKFINYLKRIL